MERFHHFLVSAHESAVRVQGLLTFHRILNFEASDGWCGGDGLDHISLKTFPAKLPQSSISSNEAGQELVLKWRDHKSLPNSQERKRAVFYKSQGS